MNEIILASMSPRRKELLENIGLSFRVESGSVDERLSKHLKPKEQVIRLANKKAVEVAKEHRDDIVIGADTVVVYKNRILGKPKDKEDAVWMLKKLSGKSHYVYTGVCIIHGDIIESFYEKTKVVFDKLSDEIIDRYTDTSEPYDKAGAYAVQGFAGVFIRKIFGDYNNVVGLPVARLYKILKTNFNVD